MVTTCSFSRSGSSIQECQGRGLEMLLEVDRICQKYGIRYFLDSGTLLGAVRHKGFIPWDDDVDIAMPRQHYESFLRICQDDLDSKYWLQTNETDPYFPFAIARILYKNSRLSVEGRTKHRTGYAMDVFAIDNAADNPLVQSARVFAIKAIQGFCKSRLAVDYGIYHSVWERIAVFVTSSIGRLLPLGILMRMQHAAATMYESRKTEYKCCLSYRFRELDRKFPSYVFDDAERTEFEGHMLPIPKGWHESLTIMYGDYMVPPPFEERISPHGYEAIEFLD